MKTRPLLTSISLALCFALGTSQVFAIENNAKSTSNKALLVQQKSLSWQDYNHVLGNEIVAKAFASKVSQDKLTLARDFSYILKNLETRKVTADTSLLQTSASYLALKPNQQKTESLKVIRSYVNKLHKLLVKPSTRQNTQALNKLLNNHKMAHAIFPSSAVPSWLHKLGANIVIKHFSEFGYTPSMPLLYLMYQNAQTNAANTGKEITPSSIYLQKMKVAKLLAESPYTKVQQAQLSGMFFMPQLNISFTPSNQNLQANWYAKIIRQLIDKKSFKSLQTAYNANLKDLRINYYASLGVKPSIGREILADKKFNVTVPQTFLYGGTLGNVAMNYIQLNGILNPGILSKVVKNKDLTANLNVFLSQLVSKSSNKQTAATINGVTFPLGAVNDIILENVGNILNSARQNGAEAFAAFLKNKDYQPQVSINQDLINKHQLRLLSALLAKPDTSSYVKHYISSMLPAWENWMQTNSVSFKNKAIKSLFSKITNLVIKYPSMGDRSNFAGVFWALGEAPMTNEAAAKVVQSQLQTMYNKINPKTYTNLLGKDLGMKFFELISTAQLEFIGDPSDEANNHKPLETQARYLQEIMVKLASMPKLAKSVDAGSLHRLANFIVSNYGNHTLSAATKSKLNQLLYAGTKNNNLLNLVNQKSDNIQKFNQLIDKSLDNLQHESGETIRLLHPDYQSKVLSANPPVQGKDQTLAPAEEDAIEQ